MRMGNLEEGQNLERMFTLSEANRLIPELERHLTLIGRSKQILGRVKEEIKKASVKASLGGGSYAGRVYIAALEQMSEHLQAIQEMGVLRSEEHTSELQSPCNLVCRLLLEK